MPLSAVTKTLFDSPPERVFDHLTKLASRLLKAPVALVSIVDEHRLFLKSQRGLPEPWATPLSHSFSQYVTASRGAGFEKQERPLLCPRGEARGALRFGHG